MAFTVIETLDSASEHQSCNQGISPIPALLCEILYPANNSNSKTQIDFSVGDTKHLCFLYLYLMYPDVACLMLV